MRAFWIVFAQVALLSFAAPASAVVNFCHEFRIQLKNEAKTVIASAGGYSDTNTSFNGTLAPGRYYVIVEGGASTSVDFNDVPNPGYCNLAGEIGFTLSSTPPADPGWDGVFRQASIYAKARTVAADQEFINITYLGDTTTTLSAQVSGSDQLGTAFLRMDSGFSASPDPSGLNVDLEVLSYGSNQFMAGFQGPAANGGMMAWWKFGVAQATDWTIDVDIEVDEGPPTSIAAAIFPTSWDGDERLYGQISSGDLVGIVVEPGVIELLVNGGPELILNAEVPKAQLGTTEYEVIVGSNSLGVFAAESIVDFVTLTGGGVTGFTLVPQGASSGDTLALYKLRMDFDSPPNSLRVIPLPEPSGRAASLSALMLLAVLLRARARC